MSRAKGNQAPAWVAAYLRQWWRHAEKTPNGLPGTDITGTPGVSWEVKTGTTWRQEWMSQAARHGARGDLHILIYVPPGMGERTVMNAQAIVPLHALMYLLQEGEFAPEPTRETA